MVYFSGPNVVNSAELRDLLIADIVLSLAFAVAMSGGISAISHSNVSVFYLLPLTFVAVSLTFVLHELMHKFVAQHYGAIAAFRTSTNGLAITLITSFLGILIGIPGATVIYTNSFTNRQNGIVSIAGPLTNFAIFAIFFAAGYLLIPHYLAGFSVSASNTYLENLLYFVPFISILLA
ncbi:MAG: hypothetical protein KGH49_04395, partial [Candidatus Micrarchaeota archaeon]|nr:hypothetical protein [Candidatus Micrarchaeota archaeon]